MVGPWGKQAPPSSPVRRLWPLSSEKGGHGLKRSRSCAKLGLCSSRGATPSCVTNCEVRFFCFDNCSPLKTLHLCRRSGSTHRGCFFHSLKVTFTSSLWAAQTGSWGIHKSTYLLRVAMLSISKPKVYCTSIYYRNSITWGLELFL